MGSAEDYRAFAAQCIELAQNVPDPADKARLMYMAQAWLDLASRLDSQSPRSEPDDKT
jgi:hypothetical protein